MTHTFSQVSISSELAQAMLRAAEARAVEIGLRVAVTVVDSSGRMKAFSRMDGAALVATDASRKKALTAVGFGLTTGKAWHDFIKDDPILAGGAGHLEDFILLGGGAPVMVEGAMCGAIGVAGGHYSHDEDCMKAALAVVSGR